MAPSLGPIVVEASKARRHLRELCVEVVERVKADNIPEGVHADGQYLADCFDRFNIWAGSLGVFQKGDASLDSRLANHGLVREVLRLLNQLDLFTSERKWIVFPGYNHIPSSTLSLVKTIIDGSQVQKTWTRASLHISRDEFDSDGLSDDDDCGGDGDSNGDLTTKTGGDQIDPDEVITESRDLHLSVNESITSLLRLSIQVHKSSRKAKFARSSVDQEYSIEPDTNHVRDFFPFAAGNEALITRLGKANAQRRQWLWYRRRHREKLSVDVSRLEEERPPVFAPAARADTESGAISPRDDGPSGSILSGTRATTFRSRPTASVISQSAMPEVTVFGASSRVTTGEQKLLVPDPPANLVFGQPCVCPYCCNITEISGSNAWE